MNREPRIALALGSGSARGWAHIGILQALDEIGLRPDIIAGTSIGALVGGAYAVGELDALEDWVRRMDRLDILRLMDARLSEGGFMRGDRLMRAIAEHVSDRDIKDLPVTYAAVATEFQTGREVWLQRGSLLEAIRASIALPGLFSPVRTDEGWLLDGGLVNPVPVSLCRALGADIVIAANLSVDALERNYFARRAEKAPQEADDDPEGLSLLERLTSRMHAGIRLRLDRLISSAEDGRGEQSPGLFDVLAGSINIVQERITRSRMAGDPPDVQIRPRLARIRLMEFDRGAEAIEGGIEAVREAEADLRHLVDRGLR